MNGSSSLVMVISLVLSLALSVFMMVCNCKLYKKAGENPIAAIVPIWNLIVMTKIATGKPALVLLYFIPIVGLIFGIYVNYKYLRRFSKSAGPAIFAILFVPALFVVLPMLAFAKDDISSEDAEAYMNDYEPISESSSVANSKTKNKVKEKPSKMKPVKCKGCKNVIPDVKPGQHFICGYCLMEQDAK